MFYDSLTSIVVSVEFLRQKASVSIFYTEKKNENEHFEYFFIGLQRGNKQMGELTINKGRSLENYQRIMKHSKGLLDTQ